MTLSWRKGIMGVLGVMFASACDVVFVEPQRRIEVEARFVIDATADAAPVYGDFGEVLDKVRLVYLSIQSGGETRDTVVAAHVAEGEVRAVLLLRAEEKTAGSIPISAELRAAQLRLLFRGQGLLELDGLVARATLDLAPVADEIDVGPNVRTVDAVADTVALVATARFSTDDVIVGADFAWVSSNPMVVQVLSDGRAITRSNGEATITASSLGASASTTFIVLQTATTFSAVAPADTTISVGSTFQLRPLGLDPNGSPLLPGAAVTWTAGPGLTVDERGVVRGNAAGASYVDGSAPANTHRASVTVVP